MPPSISLNASGKAIPIASETSSIHKEIGDKHGKGRYIRNEEQDKNHDAQENKQGSGNGTDGRLTYTA